MQSSCDLTQKDISLVRFLLSKHLSEYNLHLNTDKEYDLLAKIPIRDLLEMYVDFESAIHDGGPNMEYMNRLFYSKSKIRGA